ncbi:hypothetical protein GJ496_010800, partial [Pomphorhynchus laevis]
MVKCDDKDTIFESNSSLNISGIRQNITFRDIIFESNSSFNISGNYQN